MWWASRIPSTTRLHKAQSGSNPVRTNSPVFCMFSFAIPFPTLNAFQVAGHFKVSEMDSGFRNSPLTNSHQPMKSAHESPAEADSKQKMVIHVPRRYTALFLNMIFDVICHICFFFCSLLAAWGLVRHWRNPQKKSCVWRRFCKTVAGHLPWKLFSVSFVVLQGRRPTLAYSFMSWQRNGKQHIAACNQQKSRSQDFSVRDFSQEYNYIQMQWERRIGLSVSLNPYRQYHAIFVEKPLGKFQ